MDEFLAGNYNECIQKYEQLLLEEIEKLKNLSRFPHDSSASHLGKKRT
jgi:hypothetical protein